MKILVISRDRDNIIFKIMSSYKKEFETKIKADLKKKLGFKSVMAVPEVEKIMVNTSMKSFLQDKKSIQRAAEELAIITGQKAKVSKARTSIATFKLREGDKIGLSVTIRGKRMYDFLEKLISVVFPRVKDFSGIDLKAFDGRGNISVGFSEQIVFPEIDPGQTEAVRSLQITIVTSARNNDEGKALLEAFGMPFKKEAKSSKVIKN